MPTTQAAPPINVNVITAILIKPIKNLIKLRAKVTGAGTTIPSVK